MTTQRRRVVLLAYHFPPDPAVGGIRPSRLARLLVDAGHEVLVITARLPGEAEGFRDVCEGYRVLPVPVTRNPRFWISELRLAATDPQVQAEDASGPSTGKGSIVDESPRAKLKRWLLSILWLPDDLQGFVSASFRAIDRWHRERRVDLIYASGPPFSSHLAGLLASILLQVRLASEYRDPWTDGDKYPHIRSAAVDAVERWLERAALRRAEHVVAATKSIACLVNKTRSTIGRPENAIVSYNGTPPSLGPGTARLGPITILHAGVLYIQRDPRPFLRTIAAGLEQHGLSAKSVRIVFLGAGGGDFGGVSVLQMACEVGLDGAVEVHGQVGRDECLRRMAGADILLLLAQHQPTQVPNKLFDYLAACRPILAYADPDGESAALLRAVGGHTIIHPGSPLRDSRVVEAVLAARMEDGSRWRESKELEALSSTRQMWGLLRSLGLVSATGS